MYRTLTSANGNQTIDPADEAAYTAAVLAELPHPTRETHSVDDLGEIDYHYAVVEYTDPIHGKTRWAVYCAEPASVEISDHDTLTDAEREYEDMVINTLDNATVERDEDGDELPMWEATDVDPDVVAAHRAAERAETIRRDAQADADRKAALRAVAVAELVDAHDAVHGRGGTTEASRRLALDKGTVSALVKKARGDRTPTPPRTLTLRMRDVLDSLADHHERAHRPDLTDAERADEQLAVATGWTGIAGAMRALARAALTEADAITARLDAETGDRDDDNTLIDPEAAAEEERLDAVAQALYALRTDLLDLEMHAGFEAHEAHVLARGGHGPDE